MENIELSKKFTELSSSLLALNNEISQCELTLQGTQQKLETALVNKERVMGALSVLQDLSASLNIPSESEVK